MKLKEIDREFSICKIDNIEHVDFTQEFVFLSKTSDEISLVCETSSTPANVIESDPGWRAIMISGVLDFGMVGVLANISGILAEAGISIFAVSTYNTDYVLMKNENFNKGINVLTNNGYVI